MFGVRSDRFDHQVKPIGAVDLARYAVGHSGPDELGFCEVVESVNALCVEVLHQEHRARRVLRPREQEQVIGAEVEHEGGRPGAEDENALRPIGSAVEGFARRTPPTGYRTARRLIEAGGELLFRRIRVPASFTQAVAAQQEDFGVLHEPVGDSRRDGRVEQDVAPVVAVIWTQIFLCQDIVGNYPWQIKIVAVIAASIGVGRVSLKCRNEVSESIFLRDDLGRHAMPNCLALMRP
jgi:hypothetical protein